jgi:hypothetical protein
VADLVAVLLPLKRFYGKRRKRYVATSTRPSKLFQARRPWEQGAHRFNNGFHHISHLYHEQILEPGHASNPNQVTKRLQST